MSTATELLRRAQRALEASDDHYELQDSIEEFLAAEPEAEPVAWTSQDELNTLGTDVTCYMYSEPSFGEMYTENDIPLYLHPPRPEPSRKPMTEREIMDLAKSFGFDDISTMDFAIGFRFAEKHHDIGGDDE